MTPVHPPNWLGIRVDYWENQNTVDAVLTMDEESPQLFQAPNVG